MIKQLQRPSVDDLNLMRSGDVIEVSGFKPFSFEVQYDGKFLLYVSVKNQKKKLYFVDSNAFLIVHRMKNCDYKRNKGSLYA